MAAGGIKYDLFFSAQQVFILVRDYPHARPPSLKLRKAKYSHTCLSFLNFAALL